MGERGANSQIETLPLSLSLAREGRGHSKIASRCFISRY